MKKLLSLLLVTAMVLSIFAGMQISSSALEPTGQCGDNMYWTFDSSNGELMLSGSGAMYIKYSNNSSSPFKNQSNIKSVIIETGITSICSVAFYGCTGLKTVSIPETISSIPSYAFYDCRALTSIIIPDSVTIIGDFAFYNCTGLKSLTIPISTEIFNSPYTFGNCKNIEMLTITKGDGTYKNYSDSTSGNNTYYMYTPWLISSNALSKLIIQSGVTNIGETTFRNCKKLNDISFPSTLNKIGEYAFTGCVGLNYVYIPDSVSVIGVSAFGSCSSLNSVSLGKSLKIDSTYFSGCNNLKHLIFRDGIPNIEKNTFEIIEQITLPADQKADFSCFNRCNNLQVINLTKGNRTMADWSIDYTDSLWYLHKNTIREINIEEGIENISESAFAGCSNLIKTNVPYGVKNIGAYAYHGCSNLRSITIYSPNCLIPDNENTIDSFTTIYGYDNSTAKAYAEKYGRTFVSLGEYICEEHSLVTDEAIAPTCTQAGLTEGTHCSICSKVITEQTFIPALGHDFKTEVITESNCTENGLVKCTCNRCGLIETQVVEKLGHAYQTKVTEPTCISKGFTVYNCTNCGDSYRSDYVPATGIHDYKATVTTPATCSLKGVKTFTCSICGNKYTEEIPMTEHTAVIDKAVEATCTKSGLTAGSHCSVCGYVIVKQEVVEMKEHTVANDSAVEPTCTKSGLTAGTHCSVCGKVLTAQTAVSAKGHNYNAVVTAPTCKDKGYTTHTCTVCGDSYKDTLTNTTTNHNYKATVTTPATCTKTGVKTFTCSICGDKYTESIPMVHHNNVTDAAVAATCTKTGLTEGTHCSVCGTVGIAQNTVAKKAHNYTSVVTSDSTCSQTGVKTFTCTVCGENYTQSIALKEHTVVADNAVAPTCTKYGLDGGSHCSTCGKVFDTQERIEPLGHDFGDVVTPATLTANGEIAHPCSRCEKSAESEVIYSPKTFTLAKTSYVYTGKAIAPAVTVKDSKGKALVKGTDYDVVYKNNINIGTASVAITFKGNYKGTKTLTFTILPKATKVTSATAAKKAFTAKWGKVVGVTGYQLQYSTNAKFTKATTKTIKGAAKYSLKVANLKGGTKYFVRVRTYKTIGGKNYYSTWSPAKSVKTK